MGMDQRIGPAFLNAGIGYGGSCFPKDTRSLIHTAESLGVHFELVRAVVSTNERQPLISLEKVRKAVGGSFEGKTMAVLGLAFKGNTDDLRDSKAIDIIRALKAGGATVRAYDPVAMPGAAEILPDVTFCKNAYEAADGAEALLVVTEWNEFKLLNFGRLASHLSGNIVFDGRNLYDPKRVESYGFTYIGVGRSAGKIESADSGTPLIMKDVVAPA
jgi:UDPglucose 6-dehydrogenase